MIERMLYEQRRSCLSRCVEWRLKKNLRPWMLAMLAPLVLAQRAMARAARAMREAVQALVSSLTTKAFCAPREADPPIVADVLLAAACQPNQTSSECRMGLFSFGGAFTQRAVAAAGDMAQPTWRQWMAETAARLARDGFDQVPMLMSLGPAGDALLDEPIPATIQAAGESEAWQ